MNPAMLALIAARAASSGGGPLTATHLGAYATGTDGATYTATDVPLGTPSADRHIVVVYSGRSASTLTVTSATIAGVAAAIDVQHTGEQNQVAILRAHVPTGTTGTVTVNMSSAAVRGGIGVWAVTGGTPAVAGTGRAAGTAPLSVIVDAAAGGVAVAGIYSGSAAGADSWVGVTPDYSLQTGQEAGRIGGASASTPTAGPLTITAQSYVHMLTAVTYTA